MGLRSPWDDNKKNFFINMNIKQTNLRCNTKHLQGINPMGIGAPRYPLGQNLPTEIQN